MLFNLNLLVIFLSFSLFIVPIWSESPEENDGVEIENEIEGESEIEESSNDEGNPLLDALISSGLNLDQLGTVFGQLPQTIDTLQKMFSAGGNENEKQNEDEDNSNPLLDALGLDGLNLNELGGIENFAEILASLQEKIQERINPTELANSCPQPDPIDMFLFKDPFEAYEYGVENVEGETEEHQEIPPQDTKDEL